MLISLCLNKTLVNLVSNIYCSVWLKMSFKEFVNKKSTQKYTIQTLGERHTLHNPKNMLFIVLTIKIAKSVKLKVFIKQHGVLILCRIEAFLSLESALWNRLFDPSKITSNPIKFPWLHN